ncbi:hypothetical protein Nepgr_027323 [Nepenthes gracilis]|uniref:Uncharacterized protein n=1 Tax=Nepenthes gracilis TaxID=150966 RepID=A0AAD3T9P1_NEPGR|nr:hypothetical protein Nepgr_027323 [Nepenthes gracilis]
MIPCTHNESVHVKAASAFFSTPGATPRSPALQALQSPHPRLDGPSLCDLRILKARVILMWSFQAPKRIWTTPKLSTRSHQIPKRTIIAR